MLFEKSQTLVGFLLQGVPRTPYGIGTQVEVARLKESVPVAWFSAVVVKTIWNNCFLVEYINLRKDDGKELIREIVDSQHVRPCVLHVPIVKFDQLDGVEAFYENGWWPGVITKINAESWYTVKSIHWDKEREFCHTMLRLRYDLVDGQWTQKPQVGHFFLNNFKFGFSFCAPFCIINLGSY